MMPPSDRNPVDPAETQLDQLFHSYRQGTEFGDAGPNFMPQVWQRIEARRKNSFVVEKLARLFATATAALAVAAGLWVSVEPPASDQDSWVEELANQDLAQTVSYYEPVRLSPARSRGADLDRQNISPASQPAERK